jgi:hypothetical protein
MGITEAIMYCVEELTYVLNDCAGLVEGNWAKISHLEDDRKNRKEVQESKAQIEA